MHFKKEKLEQYQGTHAPLKARIIALLLDYLIIVLYGVLVVGTISIVFRPVMTSLFTNSVVTAQLTGFFMMTLPVSLYFILCERSKWQGTWGKKKLGIRVVKANGKQIGLGRSIVRTGIKFLPWEVAHFGVYRLMLPTYLSEMTIIILLNAVFVVVFIYIFSPLMNERKKSVYDWIAGTEVVR